MNSSEYDFKLRYNLSAYSFFSELFRCMPQAPTTNNFDTFTSYTTIYYLIYQRQSGTKTLYFKTIYHVNIPHPRKPHFIHPHRKSNLQRDSPFLAINYPNSPIPTIAISPPLFLTLLTPTCHVNIAHSREPQLPHPHFLTGTLHYGNTLFPQTPPLHVYLSWDNPPPL